MSVKGAQQGREDGRDHCTSATAGVDRLNPQPISVARESLWRARAASKTIRPCGPSRKITGPPERVGLGGNSGPAASLYMTQFRQLVVVSSTAASPLFQGGSPIHRNESTQPCRWRDGSGWCIANWLPPMANRTTNGVQQLPPEAPSYITFVSPVFPHGEPSERQGAHTCAHTRPGGFSTRRNECLPGSSSSTRKPDPSQSMRKDKHRPR